MLQMAKQLGLRIATSPERNMGARERPSGSPNMDPATQRSLHGSDEFHSGSLRLSREVLDAASPSPSDSYPTTPTWMLRGGDADTSGQPSSSSSRLASQNLADAGTLVRCNSEPLPEDFPRRFFGGSSSSHSRPQSPMAPGKRGRLEECVTNEEMTGARGQEHQHQLLHDPPGSPSCSRRRLLPGDSRRLQENLAANKDTFISRAMSSAPDALALFGSDDDPQPQWPQLARTNSVDASSMRPENHNLSALESTPSTSSIRSNKLNPVSLFNRFLVHRNTWDGAQDQLPELNFPDGSTRGTAGRGEQGQEEEDGRMTAAADEGGEEADRGPREPRSTPEVRTSTGEPSIPVLQSQVRSLQEQLQEAQLRLAASRAQADADAARIAALEKQIESTQQQVGSWRKLYLETLPSRR